MNIISKRSLWLTISGILVAISLVSLLTRGINLGIDFTGGSLLEIRVAETVTSDDIRGALSGIENADDNIGVPLIQAAGDDTFLIKVSELDDETRSEVDQSLGQLAEYEQLSFTSVGPSVGASVQRNAVIGIVLALIVVVLFIAYAFRKVPKPLSSFSFGVITIITLAHDVFITLGVFSILQYEVNSFFVTAMLTVLGYSVNDTIVVFDRVRETVVRKLYDNFEQSAEFSVQSTIMRSVNTSVTLLITLIALYVYIGGILQNFLLALIVGVIIGTYSSIFLATPLLVSFEKYQEKRLREKAANEEKSNKAQKPKKSKKTIKKKK